MRLPIPDLNEERRVEIKKIIKSMGEKCKVSIRNIRREANDDLKKLLKSKNISEDLINLKEIGYEIISVEQTNNSISLENFTPKKNKIVLIFGNEIKGISQEIIDITDTAVEIKQYGTKHSFNVSVTSAICLWEISKSLEGF